MFASLKLYILSLMIDKRNGFPHVIVKGFLRVLSWVYAIAVGSVNWGFRSGMRRQHKVKVSVISVGNITLGGTGKTPFVMYIVDRLLSMNAAPAVLTRGYGKDECRMIKEDLPGVPVFVGQDRVLSAARATREEKNVLVLDDGFQHRRIKRDLDIVLLDSVSFSGSNSLFPRGTLREPVSSLNRADMFVLTKIDMAGEERKRFILKKLEKIAPGKPVVTARHMPSALSDPAGGGYSMEDLKGERVCIVSGIGDPDYFEFITNTLGVAGVLRIDYADHHSYTQDDISRICDKCAGSRVEKIITTRKDYVKMKDLDVSSVEKKLFILDIVINITEGEEKISAGLNSVISG